MGAKRPKSLVYIYRIGQVDGDSTQCLYMQDWTGRWGYESMGLHKTLNTITGEYTECTQGFI